MERGEEICQVCLVACPTRESLGQHLLEHLVVQCPLCNKTLRNEHTLKCHIKTVHGEKKFSCDKCGKKFPHKGVLNAHIKIHDNTAYMCTVCNETFRDASYFKKHVRSHSGTRPHTCTECGKSYMQNSHLKVHMSLHTKEKQFLCEICKKRFRLAKSFKEHQNMHKNIKNFKCSLCSYSSSFRKNLYAHVKNHSKNSDPKDVGLEADEVSATAPPASDLANPVLDVRVEEDSPVYLFVNVAEKNGSLQEQIFSIEGMETLEPLEMAQELSITTQPEEYSEEFECEDYRPLDLSVVPPQLTPSKSKLSLSLKTDGPFLIDNSGDDSPEFSAGSAGFSTQAGEHFPGFSLRGEEFEPRSGETSPELSGQFLDFTVDNGGRRRSVFLAEQLEYEHQGEMRVVDPTEVTG